MRLVGRLDRRSERDLNFVVTAGIENERRRRQGAARLIPEGKKVQDRQRRCDVACFGM
ncbi:MAG TPA: hypothetical protein VET85_10185 [Stellaceae bacterium]|nr:hypothetical protein [Stellaceae bacterium]